MTPNLRIKLLGEFRLLVDEQPLTSVITRRQQALLAYLLLHRHAPQPRLYVAYSFWPDSAEGQAQTNLRKLFFELRKVLPSADEFIFADSQSLGWRHDAPFTLDVTELEQALEDLEEASTPDVAVVQRVVALYQGDLFPACYEEWLLPIRRALHEESLERRLESVKHYLWHGNTGNALQQLRWLAEDLDGWDYDEQGEPKRQGGSEGAARMLKYVQELETYISNNASYIVNYGEWYRNGDRISTGFAESTINQVISKRMVKKQQMQWTPEGAHLLLQVRTAVINEDREDTFRTWYPQFRLVVASDEESREAA